jgi:hypothetical protein
MNLARDKGSKTGTRVTVCARLLARAINALIATPQAPTAPFNIVSTFVDNKILPFLRAEAGACVTSRSAVAAA